MSRTLVLSRWAATAVAVSLLAVLGAHVAGAATGKGRGSPADELRSLEAARAKALLEADTTALSRMIAPEFVEISRFAQLRTKADNMHDIAAGDLKLTSVKYDSLTVQLYGNVAVLQGLADNTGAFRGMPFAGKLRYTRVFVRREGRWQAVAMQHTLLP